MCYEIDSKVILANRFSSSIQKDVTFGQLEDLSSKIELRVRSVVVDVSEESVFSAVEFYPELFKWNGETIEKGEKAEKLKDEEYLRVCFNYQIPTAIRDEVLEAIANFPSIGPV